MSRYFLQDLTDAESFALCAYKAANDTPEGLSRCFDLNRGLEYGLHLSDLSPSLSAVAHSLDGVFARCIPLKERMTVFRAIGFRSHLPLHVPGSKFRNQSFWSTSRDKLTAGNFLKAEFKGSYGALLELDLPAGLPVYDLETLPGAGGLEFEFLLPRDILWVVGDAKKLSIPLLEHVERQFSNVIEVQLTAQ